MESNNITTTLHTLPTNTPDQFSYRDATFEQVLDDLSSRFILNLPDDELLEVERVCFQVEQAHWYYEDFIREQNSALPSYGLKKFTEILFRSCPLLHHWSHDHETAFNDFMDYKTRVPVCGAIMLNDTLTKCVLVKGWKSSAGWSFPRGKVNENEDEALCAVREVLEETGYSLQGQIQRQHCIKLAVKRQPVTLFVVSGVPEDFQFMTQTRKEISKIDWFKLSELPGWKKATPVASYKFYLIQPVIPRLKTIVRALRKARKAKRAQTEVSVSENATSTSIEITEERSFSQSNLSSESLLITEPPFQAGSGEAELSSSQSSSADPHTPSVHGDLSPFADKISVKDVFTIETESSPVHAGNRLAIDQVSAAPGDMQNHWSRLMSRLADSDSPSLGTPQAATPTPAVSERESPANGVSLTTTSSSADSSCSTVQSPHHTAPSQHPMMLPPGDPMAEKRSRQLQLLDSVLAEETARQAVVTPPRSAHVLGRFPSTNCVPAQYLCRAASVNPALPPIAQATLPVPAPSHMGQAFGVRAPSVYYGMNSGSYGPLPRPSTALSSQPDFDPSHRAQMLAILSGTSHRTVGADYLGHRGFSSTSSLSGGNRQRGGANARLLSILNGEVGRR